MNRFHAPGDWGSSGGVVIVMMRGMEEEVLALDVKKNSSFESGTALKMNESFKNKLFPREGISRVHVVEGSQLVPWLHNTLHNLRNNTRRRRDTDGGEMSLTCSPLRFLKSFSLISVILLFCRSSRVVSSGMSSGTAFRPDGKRLLTII